jgi:tetratricopeptide (TPR) repeat protein
MWSRRSIEALIGVSLLAATSACTVTPRHPARPAAAVAAAHPAAGKPTPAGPPPVPLQAQREFGRALALARAGNDAAAEAQLASLTQRYAQLQTPWVDLGILYRRDGNLAAAAHALRQAATRHPHSALAWTELGVTERLGGQFQAAERSYAHAIAADPRYAPAWRDRGVLRDLYLNEPAAALGDFEQYRRLTGEDKPVAMWIAELQHRTGLKAPPGEAPAATPAAASAGTSSQPPAPARAAPRPDARN